MLDFSFLLLHMSLGSPPHLITFTDTYTYIRNFLRAQSLLHYTVCIYTPIPPKSLYSMHQQSKHWAAPHQPVSQSLRWTSLPALTADLFCSSGLKVLLPDRKTKGNRQKIFNGTSCVTLATLTTLCVLQIPLG